MNELIFNGKRLSEFGAFYDSHQAFNTPERDLEYVEILGRDGDLIIDNDRFKNIEINFPCYIPTDFLPKYRNLMAYLNSQRGYKRLEYSQEPDHYRLASFAGNVEASPLQLHRAGRFTLPFICKPQRFLKSGEIPVSASSQSVSYEGNPVEIDNPSGLSAVSSLSVALNPIQTGTGEPSPTNIRPITGHSSVSVTRTGKNLYWLKSETKRGLTLTANENGTYALTGEFTGTSNNVIGNSDAVTLKTGTYILNSGVTSTYYGIQIFNSDTPSILATSYGTDVTFTLSADTNVTYRIWIAYNASMGSANVTFRPMLRPSGTTSDFEPYQAQTVTIDLDGTRYGGTLNVTTGVLTVDRAYKTVGEMTWTYNSSNGTFLTTSADGKKAGYLTIISDRYIPTNASLANMENGTIRGHATNATSVYIKDERYTDADTFKTAQADAQIVYELATPFTYNLTPQQISLLTGVNYISSSDEVTVTVTEPSILENPTLFESKPLIRVYGNGVLTINNQYITIAENPYEYIDIDCDMMDCYYNSNNANQYVTFSTNDYITLKSGSNYVAYDGTVQITPRWYEV